MNTVPSIAILDLIPLPMLIVDSERRCWGANARAEQILAETRSIRIQAGFWFVDDRKTAEQLKAASVGHIAVHFPIDREDAFGTHLREDRNAAAVATRARNSDIA